MVQLSTLTSRGNDTQNKTHTWHF